MWRFLPILLVGCALETADLERMKPDVCKAAVICDRVAYPIDAVEGLEIAGWTCTAAPDQAQCWTTEAEVFASLEPPDRVVKVWFEDGSSCFLELVCNR
jgi:hypothetical protein